MIAVADTSPICYLVLIGEIDLLPKLFTQVLGLRLYLPSWFTKTLQPQFEAGHPTHPHGSA
jgi:hypothetical protein